jgi:hypothetical protein
VHAIKGKYRDGTIILAEKVDWPDDTEVLVEPIVQVKKPGICAEHSPTDPEVSGQHLKLMESIEPLWLTPVEEAEWKAALQAQKEFDLATFEERAERLKGMWEQE